MQIIHKDEPKGSQENVSVLFPSATEVDSFVEAVLIRNQKSTPFHPIQIREGEILDLTDADVTALQVLTLQELEHEEKLLQAHSEKLGSTLRNMKNISNHQKVVAAAEENSDARLDYAVGARVDSDDSDDDDEDEEHSDSDDDGEETCEGGKKFPKFLKESGQILMLLDGEWVQLHCRIDFEAAKLLCYGHVEAKRPKFRLPLRNCSISFKPDNRSKNGKRLKNILSFQINICQSELNLSTAASPIKCGSPSGSPGKTPHHAYKQAYCFRTLSILQLWEWTTTLQILGDEFDGEATIASRKRFKWSNERLDKLEQCLEVVVEKKLLQEKEREVIYHTASAFGKFDDILLEKNGLAVVGTDDHLTRYAIPPGAVVCEIGGTRVLRLDFGSTVSLLEAAPSQKPLRVKYRIPKAAVASVCAREKGVDWKDCIVKVNNFRIVFEKESTVLETISLKDELIGVVSTLSASKSYPLTMTFNCANAREITLRFKSLNKLLNFWVGLYSTTVFLGGLRDAASCGGSFISPELLAAIDLAGSGSTAARLEGGKDEEESSDESDFEGGEGEGHDDGPEMIDGEEADQSFEVTEVVEERDLYASVDKLQAQLGDLEGSFPSVDQLRGLREELTSAHRKNASLIAEMIEEHAKEERLSFKREEGKLGKRKPKKGESIGRAGDGSEDSPLKNWRPPTIGYAEEAETGAAALSPSLPTLSQIMESAQDDVNQSYAKMKGIGNQNGSDEGATSYAEEGEGAPNGSGSAETAGAKLDGAMLSLYGKLMGEILENPRAVIASAAALSGNATACRDFCKIIISRFGCRYTAGGCSSFLVPLLRSAAEHGDLSILFILVSEICSLPDVVLFSRSLARQGGWGQQIEQGAADIEDKALVLVTNLVQNLEGWDCESVPDALVGCLKELSRGEFKGKLSPEQVFCQSVLYRGVKEEIMSGQKPNSVLETYLKTYLGIIQGGTGSPYGPTIYMQAKTAGLQFTIRSFINQLLGCQAGFGKELKACKQSGELPFESSFESPNVTKPKEMLNLLVLKCEEIWEIQCGLEKGMSSFVARGGGKKFGAIASVLSALESVDWGLISEADKDKGVIIKLPGGMEWEDGDSDNRSATAIQEAKWLVQKAKAKLKSIFADRSGALVAIDVKGAKEILREIEAKRVAIKTIMQEVPRLEAAMKLTESYKSSVAAHTVQNGSPRRFNKSYENQAGRSTLDVIESVSAEERTIVEELKAAGAAITAQAPAPGFVKRQNGDYGIYVEGEGYGGREDVVGGGRGGEGEGEGEEQDTTNILETHPPTSSLATLLSTVFSPMNLQ